MSPLNILRKNSNMEVLSKVMNSLCTKYDCSVRYDHENETIAFHGDEAFKNVIAAEAADLLAPNA